MSGEKVGLRGSRLRETEVEIAAPHTYKGKRKSVKLYAIEAGEVGAAVKTDKIHWRLLTTHEVKDLADAKRMIGYYQSRWQIEQMFRVLKRQGSELEATQLETAEAIKKKCVMAIPTALQIMQLVEEREGGQRELAEAFTEEEEECLKAILPQIEGKNEEVEESTRARKLSVGSVDHRQIGRLVGVQK